MEEACCLQFPHLLLAPRLLLQGSRLVLLVQAQEAPEELAPEELASEELQEPASVVLLAFAALTDLVDP